MIKKVITGEKAYNIGKDQTCCPTRKPSVVVIEFKKSPQSAIMVEGNYSCSLCGNRIPISIELYEGFGSGGWRFQCCAYGEIRYMHGETDKILILMDESGMGTINIRDVREV